MTNCIIKKIKIIILSLPVVLGILLVNNMYAGPVYAAKWQKDGQVVLLWGDHHETNKLFDGCDIKLAKNFIQALYRSPDSVLLLLEDVHYSPTHDHTKMRNLDTFLEYVDYAAQKSSTFKRLLPHVHVKCVDMRDQSYCFLLNLYMKIQRCALDINVSDEMTEKLNSLQKDAGKLAALIPTKNIKAILNRPIKLLEGWISLTNDEGIKTILQALLDLFIDRYNTFFDVLAMHRFSEQELNSLSLTDIIDNTIYAKDLQTYERYRPLFNFFACDNGGEFDYFSPIVEACVLWNIALAPTNKNIGVVLGADHLPNLEKWLTELGYKCMAREYGEEQDLKEQTRKNVLTILYDDVMNDTTFVGNKGDEFCLRLHYTINKEKMYPLMAQKIETQYELSLENEDNVHLVSPKTFEWLQEIIIDTKPFEEAKATVLQATKDSKEDIRQLTEQAKNDVTLAMRMVNG